MANYKKNLIHVKEQLETGENIKFSVFGAYEGEFMGKDLLRTGVFVATETRAVFFSKKLFGYEFETFPYKKISSIEKSKQVMGHSIAIFASGNKIKMKWINLGDIDEFVNFINSKIDFQRQVATKEETSNNNEPDIITKIEKLSELKDKGIITEEEFSCKKSELLTKM